MSKTEQKPCACCGVFFDPTVCSQCHVAGCRESIGKKGHKCRLQASLSLPLKVAVLFFALLIPSLALSQTNPRAPVSTGDCDASLWKHVYNPQRLVVKQPCISVTGTIVDATASRKHPSEDGVRHEGDGDTHGWLKVDPLFRNLLNAGNKSDEGGNLVFEVICKFRVTQEDAVAACKNFVSDVVIPPVGSHVRITGTLVQDMEHAKWMEIHPVTKIEVVAVKQRGKK
jgi:hypothetical protein